MRPASFHSSAVPGEEIRAVMNEYLALERARDCRQLFVSRFGLLALAVGFAGIGFHLLTPLTSWFGVAVCLVPPVWACAAELRCNRRLSRHLLKIPGVSLSTEVKKA